MTESQIKSTILLASGKRPDLMLWNNPTGLARAIQPPHQPIRYGLVGSPDIIGVAAYTVKPEDVGRVVGLAFGIECKTATGRMGEQQERFAAAWTLKGGIYRVGRDLDALRAVTL